MSSIVGVPSTTYQCLFRIELSELGIAWTPSSTWTKNFLRGHGLSFKKPVKDAREAHTREVAEVILQNLRRKLARFSLNGYSPLDAPRVWNIDASALSLVPASGCGWSMRNVGSSQVQTSKATVTMSVAMCMVPGRPLLSQLIVAGKTPRVLPAHRDDVPPDMCLCYTENHWQRSDSFMEFVRFVDQRVNPSGAPHPWVLIQDLANISPLGSDTCTPCR